MKIWDFELGDHVVTRKILENNFCKDYGIVIGIHYDSGMYKVQWPEGFTAIYYRHELFLTLD